MYIPKETTVLLYIPNDLHNSHEVVRSVVLRAKNGPRGLQHTKLSPIPDVLISESALQKVQRWLTCIILELANQAS